MVYVYCCVSVHLLHFVLMEFTNKLPTGQTFYILLDLRISVKWQLIGKRLICSPIGGTISSFNLHGLGPFLKVKDKVMHIATAKISQMVTIFDKCYYC